MPIALIVEDEPDANQVLSLLIQTRGYATISSFTGSDALAQVERQVPDVIFLDLMLPDVDGYTLSRQIKGDPRTALIPLIIVTARLTEDSESQSYASGANFFMRKPFTPRCIFDALVKAAAWRSEAQAPCPSGSVTISRSNPMLVHQTLARLGNLLVGRTGLAGTDISILIHSLHRLSETAMAWGKHGNLESVAELEYRLEADRIICTIRDISGWFEQIPTPLECYFQSKPGLTPFDEVEDLPSSLRLVRHFEPIAAHWA